MRAVDTDAVVRLVVRDDPERVRAAEEFAARGAWISHLVLVETAWVLDAVYERSAEQIAMAVEMLLNHKDLTLQDADVVVGALEHFRKRPRLGFSRLQNSWLKSPMIRVAMPGVREWLMLCDSREATGTCASRRALRCWEMADLASARVGKFSAQSGGRSSRDLMFLSILRLLMARGPCPSVARRRHI